jgi:hypothetical protein
MTIPSLISEADYCAIEDALHSSEKGRRFLRLYIERNRSIESRRLLRSISRLHRAALGTPGARGEPHRDLVAMLRLVEKHKRTASGFADAAMRARILETSLEEVESCLVALIESLEERTLDSLPAGSRYNVNDGAAPASSATLFGDL